MHTWFCLSIAGTHMVALVDIGKTQFPKRRFILHALCRAGIFSNKEPAGLSLSDEKSLNGLTLTPWQTEKNAIWDVTVTDTLALSYLNLYRSLMVEQLNKPQHAKKKNTPLWR